MAIVKPVRAVVELGANYAFHLLAASRIGFASDYAERYRDSVHPDDLTYIDCLRPHLSFSDGHVGRLCLTFVFLIPYLGFATYRELDEFLTLLDGGLVGDWEPLLMRYREHFDRLRLWIGGTHYDANRLITLHAGVEDEARRLSAIYRRNFASYEQRVWPQERRHMDAVATGLNNVLEQRDIVGDWERLTGLTFKTDSYEIMLCSAIANGPTANSLGYDRNVFYSGSDPQWMMDFISHETGTHLLIDVFNDVVGSGRYAFDLAYQAYENMARFYNSLILRRHDPYGLNPSHDYRMFHRIYTELHRDSPDQSPRQMLITAIESYRQTQG